MALALAASGLFAIGSAAPAVAVEPVSCTERVAIDNQGATYPPFDRPMVRTDMQEVESAALIAYLSPGMDDTITLMVEGRGFREEFATVRRNSPPGEYRFESSPGASGLAADPDFTYSAPDLGRVVAIDFSPTGGQKLTFYEEYPYPLYDGTLVLNYRDCDEDADSWGDKSYDNCVGVANPDQADFDTDGVGDACDPDDDADGAPDTTDNCPGLANSQADSDGDGIGDECDSTPQPPAPTPSPSPTTTAPTAAPTAAPTTPSTAVPTVVTAPVVTGSAAPVAAAREVRLRYKKRKRLFRGTVGSTLGACAVGTDVSLWRKRPGKDQRLVVSTTNDKGVFRTPKVRKRGKYYVSVAASADGVCAAATSSTVRIRRR